MKRTLIREKQVISTISKCAAALLFVLLAVWVFGLLLSVTRIKTERIYLTPIFTDARGWEIYTMENGIRREISTEEMAELETGKVFDLSRILTKELENEGYTFLRLGILRPCAVFLDGELLYTNCPRNDMRMDANKSGAYGGRSRQREARIKGSGNGKS